MSAINSNTTPHPIAATTAPAGTNAPAAPAPQAAPAANVPAAIAPSPEQALSALQQRYPGVDSSILTGKGAVNVDFKGLPKFHDSVKQQIHPGTTPIVLGTMNGNKTNVVLMPTAGVPGPDVNGKIQQFVKQGESLYKQVMSGNGPGQPSKEQVKDMMWYLQALGSSKATISSSGAGGRAMYASGAMTIEDPGDRLATFFENANSYTRKSSHLNQFQNQPGCQPFGVDVRNVPTPNERRTVLLQRLPQNEMGGKQMLFLKMEENGCRGLSFKGTGHGPAHDAGLSGWGSFTRGVKRFFSNIGDFVGHAFGFFRSQAQQAGMAGLPPQDNRERVDHHLTARFNDVVDLVGASISQIEHTISNPTQKQQVKDQLAKLHTSLGGMTDAINSKTGGVHAMIKGIDHAIGEMETIQNTITQPSSGFTRQLGGQIELLKTIKNQITRSTGDHPDLRFGKEVILTTAEMAIGTTATIGEFDPASRDLRPLKMDTQEAAIYRDSLEYVANYPDDHTHGRTPFDADVTRGNYVISDFGTGSGAKILYHANDFRQNDEARVPAANTALNQLTTNAKVKTAIRNIAQQSFCYEQSAMLGRELLGRYGEAIIMPGINFEMEINKRPTTPPDPNLDVYNIKLVNTRPPAPEPVYRPAQRQGRHQPLHYYDAG